MTLWDNSLIKSLLLANISFAALCVVVKISGVFLVSLLSVVCFIALTLLCGFVVISWFKSMSMRTVDKWFILGCSLIILSWFRSLIPGINLLKSDNLATIQSIDNRFFLSQAESVKYYGDLTGKLDFHGGTFEYHSLPADTVGAWAKYLPFEIAPVLLFVVPMVLVLTILISLFVLVNFTLRKIGLDHLVNLSYLSLGLAISIPFTDTSFSAFHPQNLLGGIPFSSGIMLNSLFAMSCGLSSIAVLSFSRNKIMRTIAFLGIASLVWIKPQYFIGFCIILLGSAFLISFKDLSWNVIKSKQVIFVTLIFVGFVVLQTNENSPFTNNFRISMTVPDFEVANSRWVSIIGVAFILLVYSISRVHIYKENLKPEQDFIGRIVVKSLILYMSLIVCFDSILAIYIGPSEASAFATTSGKVFEINFAQALDIPTFFVHLLGLIWFIVYLVKWKLEILTKLLGSILSFVYMCTATLSIINPLSPRLNYEVVNVSSFADIARFGMNIPGLSIASDLTDPDGNHWRRLSAHYLPAYSHRPFYLANVRYFHAFNPKAPARVKFLRELFESQEVGPFLESLRAREISKIYINKRCTPAWRDYSRLSLVYKNEDWMLFRVPTAKESKVLQESIIISGVSSDKFPSSKCI